MRPDRRAAREGDDDLADRVRLHPEYDESATADEIVADENELIRKLEAGDVPVFSGPRDPASAEWRQHCREAREWREAQLAGRCVGPKPEAPATPAEAVA
jgi:hypothetical protein